MSFSSSHAFLLLFVFVVTSTGICQPKWLSKENAQRKPASMSLRDSAAPKNAVLLYLKAVEKGMLKGNQQVAEEYFRKALAIYPQFDSAIAGLGQVLSDEGRWDEAERMAVPALDASPQHPGLLRLVANLLQRRQDYARSLPLLRRAYGLDPHAESGLVLLARAEYMTGDYKSAHTHSEQAHNESPHVNPVSHLVNAQCHEKAHEFGEARAEYEIYLRESHRDEASNVIRKHLESLPVGGE